MPKVSKKKKNTQREALLSLIYQQELFEHVDEEDTGESKEFREFITEEAKERGVDSLELIDYFAENREELTEVLKKRITINSYRALIKFTALQVLLIFTKKLQHTIN